MNASTSLIEHPPLRQAPASTSIREKLLDLVANPVEVFAEVAETGSTAVNWRVPVLLICLTTVIQLYASQLNPAAAPAQGGNLKTAKIPPAEVATMSSNIRLFAMLAACGAAFVGTFWSALVLWLIGRVFLNIRFSYWKSLEVATLSGFILVPGAIATVFVAALSDNPGAHPSLSILLPKAHLSASVRAVLDDFNLFYLWSVALMAIGFSKLAAISLKEAAFWVFGYWVVLRALLCLIGGGAV